MLIFEKEKEAGLEQRSSLMQLTTSLCEESLL
jgi:hypothetical protein